MDSLLEIVYPTESHGNIHQKCRYISRYLLSRICVAYTDKHFDLGEVRSFIRLAKTWIILILRAAFSIPIKSYPWW